MPELMENILSNLNEEFYSLYSCALVNRHWCKMSIPILWRDPFSFEQKPIFISRYFIALNEDYQFILKDCGISVDFSNTLFHYAKFLKVLNLSRLEKKVKQWIGLQLFNSQKHINTLTYHIANLLFKLFIESGTTLSKLDLYIPYDVIEIKPEIFYSLGRNEHFFSRLQDLSVGAISDFCIEDATTLLGILAKNTRKINTLTFNAFESDYEPKLYHTFLCIVKSQEQLKRFDLIGGEGLPAEFYGIISALEYQKNSLQEIKIDYCAYSKEFETLSNCEKLKVIRILYCDEDNKLLKILNTNCYRICTLEITSYSLDALNIIQILEKSGLLLQRLKLNSEEEEISSQSNLLETLTTYCPNIVYLYISHIELSQQFLKLVESLQKLQYLTLLWINDGPEEVTKGRVMQFAEKLPLTLQYLNLGDIWSNSHINILLNHCNVPLKQLLFSIDCD
ncbi:hypothetical protein C2G38_2094998, partial [Gigaspora rosea]